MTRPKILIADDDLAELHLLALHLRNEDYEVTSVVAADEVIPEIRQVQPDLMLVDVGMVDGTVGVHEMLTEFPDVAAIPTLYLVGRKKRDQMDRRRHMLPPSVTVEKPIIVSDLLARVAAALTQVEGDDAPRQRVA